MKIRMNPGFSIIEHAFEPRATRVAADGAARHIEAAHLWRGWQIRDFDHGLTLGPLAVRVHGIGRRKHNLYAEPARAFERTVKPRNHGIQPLAAGFAPVVFPGVHDDDADFGGRNSLIEVDRFRSGHVASAQPQNNFLWFGWRSPRLEFGSVEGVFRMGNPIPSFRDGNARGETHQSLERV